MEIQSFQGIKKVRFLLVTKCNETPFLSILSFGGLQQYFRSYANHLSLCYDCFCAARRYIHHKAETTDEFEKELSYDTLLHSSYVNSTHAVQSLLLTRNIIIKILRNIFLSILRYYLQTYLHCNVKQGRGGSTSITKLVLVCPDLFLNGISNFGSLCKWKKPCQCIILQAMSWPWHFCFSTLLIFFHNIWH